jgi:hypothetical protein
MERGAGFDAVPASAVEVMTSPARALLGWFADDEYIPQSRLISARTIFRNGAKFRSTPERKPTGPT